VIDRAQDGGFNHDGRRGFFLRGCFLFCLAASGEQRCGDGQAGDPEILFVIHGRR